ncbi:MAG: hypothetical protein Q4G05_00260 [Clostridia bacterium]|nr:hypothetical protein [Clostridia bacterium]
MGILLNLFKKKEEKNCNDEINILDIRNNFVYTRDNLVIGVLKINSINMQLFSNRELEQKVLDLTTELSGIDKEFKLFSISRPVDVTGLVDELRDKLNNENNTKIKILLKRNIAETIRLTLTGEIVERQNFMIVFEEYSDNAEKDLQKRMMDLSTKFDNCDVKTEILDEANLIQLCNSFLNINFAFKEDTDYEEKIPYIMKGA